MRAVDHPTFCFLATTKPLYPPAPFHAMAWKGVAVILVSLGTLEIGPQPHGFTQVHVPNLFLRGVGVPEHQQPNYSGQRAGNRNFPRVNQGYHLHAQLPRGLGGESRFEVIGEGEDHGPDVVKMGDLVDLKELLQKLLGRTQDGFSAIFLDCNRSTHASDHLGVIVPANASELKDLGLAARLRDAATRGWHSRP